jgi:hypothetical protein
MDFSQALLELKQRRPLRRAGWNRTCMLFHDSPQLYVEEKPCITPGLYWRNALGEVRPWTPSYDDLMADDWEIYSPRMGIGD